MSVEILAFMAGLVVALGLLGAAAIVLRSNLTLRTRLAVTFIAFALAPALLSMVTLWRQLQPQTWRRASRGVMVSLESATVLAKHVLAERHNLAKEAADEALDRLLRRGRLESASLDDLLATRYEALYLAGEAGVETVRAQHGPWSAAQTAELVRDVLPGKRSGSGTLQMVQAPDSVWVVVGVAGPVAFQDEPHYAMVVVPVPPEEAAAMNTVVESRQRAQMLTFAERLHVRYTAYAFAGLAFVFLLLALALGTSLARSLTRPIDRLRQAFEAVTAGELGVQVPTQAKAELGRLMEGFNRMSLDLQKSHQQLVRATRLAAWQDVARRLAHEIKNPLTPITLSIHRLRKRMGETDDVVRECLDTVLEETSHLQRLADEFSSFARMPKPKIEPVDAAEVLQQVLELYSVVPRLRVRAELQGLGPVLADRDQIRQVFTNVVKNAVEAMPQGGELEVRWARENGGVALTFLDQGCGFPAEAGERIFDPAFTTKASGTGLGLAIVRRILEDHGADIQAGNRSEGGAWVRIRLPAAT